MLRGPPLYGRVGGLQAPEGSLVSPRRARARGSRHMDAYTPYPVEGLATELDLPRTRVPLVVLLGGIAGAVAGFFMQYWAMAIDYPINAGGRPYNSWPAYIPITFEMLVLVAALAALLGMLFLNGLPEPYHPVFNVERFARASQDRFFLCIEATDPKFDRQATKALLESLRPGGEVV